MLVHGDLATRSKATLSRRRSGFQLSGYTLGVLASRHRCTSCLLPTKSWLGRVLSALQATLRRSLRAETGPPRARYATAVWDFMLDRFKLLSATGVPACSRSRRPLGTGTEPDRVRRSALTSAVLRRAGLLTALRTAASELPSDRLVLATRMARSLFGGFAQLGSI